jgi:hypothetical protein
MRIERDKERKRRVGMNEIKGEWTEIKIDRRAEKRG